MVFIQLLIKLGTFTALSALILFCVSGLYNDTIVEPRKFLPRANRALRPFNVKFVPQQSGWLSRWKTTRPSQALRLIVSSRAGSIQFREAYDEYRDAYWQQLELESDKLKRG